MNINVLAQKVIKKAAQLGVMVATAESCTGGLIAGALTEVPGSSAVVDRGFVTYSNEAKAEMLGVRMASIVEHGAVSDVVARAMTNGALQQSRASVAVAVTGIAGPGGGSADKPVGLVFVSVQKKGAEAVVRKCLFADEGKTTRPEIRKATIEVALEMLLKQLG